MRETTNNNKMETTIKQYHTSDFKLKDKVIINIGEAGKGVKSFWVDGVVSDIHPNRITVERKNPFGNESLEEQIPNKLLTSEYIVKEEDAEMYADGGSIGKREYTEAEKWWGNDLSTNEQKEYAKKHLENFEYSELMGSTSKYSTASRRKKFINEIWEKEGKPKSIIPGIYANGGEVNEYDYMMLGRLQSDADYYLGYGNRNEKHLWALNVDDHIKEMKNRWNALPEDKKPEWLTMEDILEYEKKMKNPTKSKFSYYKVPNEELYAIQECNPEYKDGFGSECIVIRTKKTEEAAIAEVERLNKLGYSDYAKGGELPSYMISKDKLIDAWQNKKTLEYNGEQYHVGKLAGAYNHFLFFKNGKQIEVLEDKETGGWVPMIYAKGGEIKDIILSGENRPLGFTMDKAYKQDNVMVQRVGGSTSWNVAIDGVSKGRVLGAFTKEQAIKKAKTESAYSQGGELPQQKDIELLQKGLENPLIPQNVKTKIEAKIKELQAEITKKQEEAKKASEKPTLKDLEDRLKIVKKMAAKKPELKARVKIIEKMIAKEKKNNPSKEQFIDLNIDNISDDLKKDAAFYFSDKYNLTKIDLMDDLVRYTQMQKDFNAKKLKPKDIIGSGHKPQYARGIADKWIKDRIALTKYLIKNFDKLNQLTETQKKATPKMENGGETTTFIIGNRYKRDSGMGGTLSFEFKGIKDGELVFKNVMHKDYGGGNTETYTLESAKNTFKPDVKLENGAEVEKKYDVLQTGNDSIIISDGKKTVMWDFSENKTDDFLSQEDFDKFKQILSYITVEANSFDEAYKRAIGYYNISSTKFQTDYIKKEDIEILGVPRSKISEKEWKSILSMAKHQQGATFLLKDEKGLDVEPQVEYEWYVKDKFKKGGSIPVNIALQTTEGQPYEIIKNDIPRTEAQKFIEEYKQSGKPYHNIMIDDLPFADGGEIWGIEVRKTKDAPYEELHEKLTKKEADKLAKKYKESGKYHDVVVEVPLPYKKGGETWIQDSVEKMEKKGTVGSFTNKAARHGLTPIEYAKKVLTNPDKHTEKTRRQAQFVKNTNPELFEDGGEVKSIRFTSNDYNKLVGDVSEDYPYYSIKNADTQDVYDDKTEQKVATWYMQEEELKINQKAPKKLKEDVKKWLKRNSYITN